MCGSLSPFVSALFLTTIYNMDARSTVVQRPMGPRSINRSASPLPPPLAASDATSSVNRRPVLALPKTALSPPGPQSQFTRPSGPPLTLSIPRPQNSKPSAPKIKLQINAASTGGSLFESYAGGPCGPTPQTDNRPDERTIRPESVTVMPAQRSTETFDNLRDLVTELEAIRIGLPTPLEAPEEFSDDVFEELSRLGEGAGGAVHKVRHKPTGIIMARKTVTTLEAPRKQLERELSIAASAKHINVVQWHGAYMSPSSSEIKILLEYCEGGSLEAVSMRIKERGAIVGEKIAGRLAEGVCNPISENFCDSTLFLLFVDFAGPCLPSFQEDDSPRYQTI